jgi:hypothetical protein
VATVYRVPEKLQKFYKGSGHGICAIRDGKIVKMAYLRDIIPDVEFLSEPNNDEESPLVDLKKITTDPRVGIVAMDFNHEGEIFLGMFSGHEFVIL